MWHVHVLRDRILKITCRWKDIWFYQSNTFSLRNAREWVHNDLSGLWWSLKLGGHSKLSKHDERGQYTRVPASLALLEAWLLRWLGGTGFESQLGCPFILISPHPRVCNSWPENGTPPIKGRPHARLNNQLSHPINTQWLMWHHGWRANR